MLTRVLTTIARIAITLVLTTTAGAAFAQIEPFRGTVVGKSGKAIEEVQVALRDPGGADVIDEIVTGEDGTFAIPMESIRPGYEIHLHKDGYDDQVLPINPQQLVVATISVTMLRTVGEPVAQPTPTPKVDMEAERAAAAERRERAVRMYNDAVEMYGDEKQPKYSKDQALLLFRESASIDPTFPEPLRILARLAIKQQNWAEASRYSEALIRIDPTDDEAVNTLYISLVVMRHFERVGEAAKRLISIDPEKIAYVESHAAEFYKNGQFVMARALYQALTEVAPDMPNSYLNLGLCCQALGDAEGTRAAFEKFVELAPEDSEDLDAVRQQLAALDAAGESAAPEDIEILEEPQEPE
jgi:tetratricopeptide (TPR) repeat protein